MGKIDDEKEEMIKVTNPKDGSTEEHRLNPTTWDTIKEGTMMNEEQYKAINRARIQIQQKRALDKARTGR